MDELPLTDRELTAMQAAWNRGGEATVKDLLEDLPEDTPYTSALSIYQTLEGKGLVTHRREGRKYVYVAAETREDCRLAALRYVLKTYYGGDTTTLEYHLSQLRRLEDAAG